MSQRMKVRTGVTLYKQTDSKYWWCEIDLGNGTGRARLSTKEVQQSKAEAVALEYYKVSERVGSAPAALNGHKVTLEKPILAAIQKAERENKAISDDYIRILGLIMSQFRHKKAANVTVHDITDFISHEDRGSKTQVTMAKKCWRDVVREAIDLKIYTEATAPRIPDEIKGTSNELPVVSLIDRIRIRALFGSFINDARKQVSKENRLMFRFYLRFLETTGARAGKEVTMIRWCDIVEDEWCQVLQGKIHSKNPSDYREIYLCRRARMVLKEIAEMKGIKWHKRSRNEDYVFARKDGFVASFDQTFPCLMAYCNIAKGKYRPYSFRKLYITRQASKNANIYDVAKQTGTSVEMIQKYYDKSGNRGIKNGLK